MGETGPDGIGLPGTKVSKKLAFFLLLWISSLHLLGTFTKIILSDFEKE